MPTQFSLTQRQLSMFTICSKEVGSFMASTAFSSLISLAGLAGWGWSEDGVSDNELRELNLNLSDRRLRLTLDLARKLMGTPRHLSQHPGGFVLTLDRLDALVPIEPAAMEKVRAANGIIHVIAEHLIDQSDLLRHVGDSDEAFAIPARRGDEAVHGGGAPDSRDAKALRHAARDIFIPDLHIDTLNVKARNFR